MMRQNTHVPVLTQYQYQFLNYFVTGMLGMQVAYELLTEILMKTTKNVAVLHVNSSESPVALDDCTTLTISLTCQGLIVRLHAF